MGIADFAFGAQDELQRMLAMKRYEQLQRETASRQLALDDERRQTAALTQKRWETDRSDRLAREGAAASEKAAAAAKEDAEVQAFVQQNPHLAPVVKALRIGMPVKSTHDLETPDVHGVHEQEAQASRIKNIEQETEARERAQAKYRPKPEPKADPAPQLVYADDGSLRAVRFVGGQFVEVPVPAGLSKTAPKPNPKTIQAEAAARAQGAAEGKKAGGGGGGLISGLVNLVRGDSGGAKPATVKMKAPDGSVKEVPADQVAHFKSLGAVEVK